MLRARLSQQDLIRNELFLKDVFARFLSFKSYSLYFPRSENDALIASFGPALDTAVHLPAERRIMTPLVLEGRLLGVFIAKGAAWPRRAPCSACFPASGPWPSPSFS